MTRFLLAALLLASTSASSAAPVKSETLQFKTGAGVSSPLLMVFDSKRGEIWTGGQGDDRLAVIDAGTRKVTAVIKDVKGITQLAADPAHDRVYAIISGYKLVTFSASTKERLSTKFLYPTNARALGVALDGSLLVLHYKWDSMLQEYHMVLANYDPSNLSVKATYDLPGGYSYNTKPIYVDASGIYLTRTLYENSAYHSELWVFNADLTLRQMIDLGPKTYMAHIVRDHRDGRVFDAGVLIDRMCGNDSWIRRTAYDELVIASGEALPFDSDGPWRVQQSHLRGWSAWWVESRGVLMPGRWYLDGREIG